jgi:NADP-dependent 3-hydroxy acid dehydrogenase YdfG
MASLSGKLAWITGAGSGIGQAAAIALAESGALVVLSGRRADELAATQAIVQRARGKAITCPLDATIQLKVAAAAESIAAQHGAVDILVNSAGINVPKRRYKDLSVADWDRVVDINLKGAMYTMLAVLPSMRARRNGLIINISSWLGRWPGYLAGPAYAATKHGMGALTDQLNMEDGVNGIRGCVICPGEVATPILKTRPIPPSDEEIARMLQPEDLGRLVRFVAESPAHVCLNEIVISPTWNRMYVGGADLRMGPELPR